MAKIFKQQRVKLRKQREPTTTNEYHQLLLKLYKFLSRRTDSKFNSILYERLTQSRTTRYPISLSRLTKIANTEEKRAKILAIAGKVLDDERMLTVPKMRVCALQFSEGARARILKAGGECFTFDQLAQIEPLGKNVFLLRGPRSREALSHFRGLRGDKAKPYICNNNHKGREQKYGHRD
jgi:large subunit ribosomal protein L18e